MIKLNALLLVLISPKNNVLNAINFYIFNEQITYCNLPNMDEKLIKA